MAIVGLMVLWSLIGISAKQIGEQTQYSIFIKNQPSVQVWFGDDYQG